MSTDTGLLVALDDGTLSFWDTASATRVHAEKGLPAFSTDCTSQGDRLLVTSQKNVGLLELPAFSAEQWLAIEALDASFSPDGKRFAVVGADGEVGVWEDQ